MNTLALFYRVVRKDRLLIACSLFLLVIVGMAVIGVDHTGYTYDQISDASLLPPSSTHWFGTDLNGHDLFTRTLYGARISLFVAAMGTLVSFAVGVPYGMISGYAGGRIDSAMMRLVEIIYSLPTLVLVIVLVTTLERGVTGLLHDLEFTSVNPRLLLIIGFLGFTEWLTMARIIRGQMLVLRQQTYVQAASALGQSHLQILWKHLFPNLLGLIIVYLTLTVPAIMLDEAFMSFLGVGLQPPLASWGTLISDAAYLINPVHSYWWMLLFPAGMMTLTLLAFNFLGDGLRDALDPRVRK